MNIYLSVEHDLVNSGQFSFEFWYLDLKPNLEDAKNSVTGYILAAEEVTGKFIQSIDRSIFSSSIDFCEI